MNFFGSLFFWYYIKKIIKSRPDEVYEVHKIVEIIFCAYEHVSQFYVAIKYIHIHAMRYVQVISKNKKNSNMHTYICFLYFFAINLQFY